VNVASRMESHGPPGRIHVSAAFHALTSDLFRYDDRGVTEVRGIGPAQSYFLVAAK
jgi:adenylate cyclase